MPEQQLATLDSIRAVLRSIKPNADPLLVQSIVNQELRYIVDRYPLWSGLLRKAWVVAESAIALTGVSVTQGSRSVTIAGGGLPVSDAYSATLQENVIADLLGWYDVSTSDGIQPGDFLAILDAQAEVVPVVAVEPGRIRIRANRGHSSGASIAKSSLSGRQIKIGGSNYLATIAGVMTANTMQLELPWPDSTQSGAAATVLSAYIRIAPDVRTIIQMVDVNNKSALAIYYNQSDLMRIDPGRVSSGRPTAVSPAYTDTAGNMRYELYPHPQSRYVYDCLYSCHVNELKDGGDTIPAFINPDVLIWRAASQLMRLRLGANDEYYDPATAMFYEQRGVQALEEAIRADQGKAQMLIASLPSHRAFFADAQSVAVSVDEIRY